MTSSIEDRADLLTILLAREVTNDSVVVMGTGTPLTAVATLVALRHHAAGAHYTTPLAGGLSVVPHELSLLAMERAAYDHAVLRSAQIIDLWEMATVNPVVSERWLQFFRPAQMDQHGNTNNSVIGDYHAPKIRLPGSVGISDMAAYYPRLYAYVTRHHRPAFPARVDFVSAIGTVGTVADRRARGLRWGRPYRVFTDLCVWEFDDAGLMVVVSRHPGVERAQIEDGTGFPVVFRGNAITEPPDRTELDTLGSVDPSGLRLLEFQPSRVRRAAIVEALRQSSAVLGLSTNRSVGRVGGTPATEVNGHGQRSA